VLSSGSNFAVAVVVARVAGPAGLGAFSLAYAGWLILVAIHRSLVTDPMAIEGDVRGASPEDGIRRGFASEIVLAMTAAGVFALIGVASLVVGQRSFGIAMLAMVPWLPFLQLQDYWRWVAFMTSRPGKALANDTVFVIVQAIAFAFIYFTHTSSLVALLASWGLGGVAGMFFGFYQFRLGPNFSGGLAFLRTRWGLGRWIAVTAIVAWGATQAFVYVAGFILGPVDLGGLKAAQTLVSGPAMMLIMASGSIGLPEATRAYLERGWPGLRSVARLIGGFAILSTAACTLVVALWGQQLLTAIYGPQFAHLRVASVLMGIAFVVGAFNVGSILVLKTTRNTRQLVIVQSITLVASLASVGPLSAKFGIDGAAMSNIFMSAIGVLGYRWYLRRIRRLAGAGLLSSSDAEISPYWLPEVHLALGEAGFPGIIPVSGGILS
jgi:O-antigen/teichoic acid export membrane protein